MRAQGSPFTLCISSPYLLPSAVVPFNLCAFAALRDIFVRGFYSRPFAVLLREALYL
jgi:hypothetical protein